MTIPSQNFAKTLGKRIKHHRLASKLTQEQLASALSIDTNSVSRFECGSHLPSLLRLTQLSKVLGLSLANLLGEASTNPSDQYHRFLSYIDGLSSSERDLIMEVAKHQSEYLGLLNFEWVKRHEG